MSNLGQDDFVIRSEFDALSERVEEGFLEMRRHHVRLETGQMELRREQSHHSDLLAELQAGQKAHGLILEEHGGILREHTNLLKQILEIVSCKAK